jgi:hypothetical protein
MSWIDLLWPMVTGACLTLGMINLRIGFAEKPRGPAAVFAQCLCRCFRFADFPPTLA